MNGLYIVDKPYGYSSRDVVNRICGILHTKKVGHGGTLDPIATGVLIIAVGNALRTLEFITNDTKEYIATVKIGLLTDTLDITGNIIQKTDNYSLNKSFLEKTLNSFIGKYNQEVPLYSSVRVNGKRLYKYAREKESVILPKREVEIFKIELLDFNNDEFKFKVLVSKGTYIRSLIRDIGEKIGIFCTMKELVRTKQGSISIKDSVTIEEIENGTAKLISVEKALNDIDFISVDDYLENKILNGSILENRYNKKIIGFKNNDGEVLALYEIYDKDNNKIKPIKVFKGD